MSRDQKSLLPPFLPPGEARSRNMAAIKGADTKPEVFVRKTLNAAGLRFRLHSKDLPGRPDLILPRFKMALFVHGCFWHGHGCKIDHKPLTNTPYWTAKLARNVKRDRQHQETLRALGWDVRIIWECQVVEETSRIVEELCNRRNDKERW